MCKPKEHVFFTVDRRLPVIGTRCICGLHRWGTAEQLHALDEISVLEQGLRPAWKGAATVQPMRIRGTLILTDCWALEPWGEDYAVLATWQGMLAWFEVKTSSLAPVLFP